ncbi:MAG: rod shape-determining protein RodA [Betaproteobacteria bacterium]|nr:rod shape-determining protein RodA [Betaproteobacteria bacterium]
MTYRRRFHVQKLFSALIRPLDPPLLLILSALLVYSVIIIESAAPKLLVNHLGSISLALFGMWAIAVIPTRRLLSLAPMFYIIGIALLVAVNLFGTSSKGAQRWLDIGPVLRIQPSEIMKIAMPLALAWFFQKREHSISWGEFLVSAVLLFGPVYLIAKQPDLGTAILVCSSGFFVIFFAGLPWRLIMPVVLLGVAVIVAIGVAGEELCQREKWPGLKPYQKDRICTLLDPSRDPLGKGFHTIQSTIAIGSGGFVGKGWKQGTQTHLAFLPERHTDFVFAVLAEEFGLIGVLVLLGLYMALLARGFIITASAMTLGAKLLAGSTTMAFFTYLFVNIGMVSGILPVVGVPLPFISYGGTAIVTLCLGIGILMGVCRNKQER